MQRIPVVGGNWKMHLTRQEARQLTAAIRAALVDLVGVEVILFPPSPWLADVHDALEGSTIQVGAQNVYWEPQGAFTGEVAAPMLRGTVDHVLVGHSERRIVFGESVWETADKMRAVCDAGLTPLLAVGEPMADLRAGRTNDTLRRQLVEGTRGIAAMPPGLIVAYEPVWAIGTGEPATPAAAQERCAFIRSVIADRYGDEAAEAVRIQYGGSVNAQNVASFIDQPDIDGALVGGASLDAEAFAAICRAAR
ncbi:MAG: triose-phosphate isomerase [Dehalococcoidia bacterium]|nr:triose-phosphate isomerase [Dehalococcoidia bacterium]